MPRTACRHEPDPAVPSHLIVGLDHASVRVHAGSCGASQALATHRRCRSPCRHVRSVWLRNGFRLSLPGARLIFDQCAGHFGRCRIRPLRPQGRARCRKGRSAGSVGPPESSRDRLARRRRYSLGYSGCLPGRQLIAGALNQLFPRRATIVRTITRACERPVWQAEPSGYVRRCA
jgi:hypothetical protein